MNSPVETSLAIDNAPAQPPTNWANWLSQQAEIASTVYCTNPNLLIADFNRERECSQDYEGREILELLQNASDAAAESGRPSQVEIHLTSDGLVVANTGVPFTQDGVTSLQTSNLSPKRRNRRVIIGNKGLGFRAILNLSRSPIILSGELRIAFSQEYSRGVLAKLMAANDNMADIVRKEIDGKSELPVPVLVFPAFSPTGDLRPFLTAPSSQNIFKSCENLRSKGFTTVIGMPFDRPKAFEHASEQLASLTPELLLFVRFLSSIVILRPDKPPVTWRREEDSASTKVFVNAENLHEWTVYREEKPIPKEHLGPEGTGVVDYEIVVAIPKTPPSKSLPLFSHFPTDVNLPLPVVCHATLDLQQNRQHTHSSPANFFVLGRLAEFLAEVAEIEAANHRDRPWRGCDLVMLRGELGPDLQRAGFQNKLLAAAKTKAIVPTLAGQLVSIGKAKYLSGADAKWLPLPQFGEVIPWRDTSTLAFLLSIGKIDLSSEEFAMKLIDLRDITVAVRARLISGMIRHNVPSETHAPALLLDSSGNQPSADARVFLAPSSGQTVCLPEWAGIQFLNEELRQELARELEARDSRQLQMLLSSFRVVEYSQDNLISSFVAATNRRTKADPANATQYETELIKTLFQIFSSNNNEEERPKFPSESSIRLPTQAGTREDARTLYLGVGYPPVGNIVQEFFESWAPTKLVAAPDVMGLQCDAGKLTGFLRWLGVADWPRAITETTPDSRFVKYALRSLTYPAAFGEQIYDSKDQVPSPSVAAVKSVESLEVILQKADPFAIIAWLALDDRASHWQRSDVGHATLRCTPYRKWYSREYAGALPSYIRWRIQHTAWLPLTNKAKGMPSECITGERAIEAFFPRPLQPPPEILAKYGISAAQVRDGWTRAGVIPGLAYLERTEIYRILLELPTRNPDGQSAKALYRWLMDAEESAIGDAGAASDEFKKRGKMWGRYRCAFGYFPVGELRHADTEDFPEPLLQKLKIVDLPKRVGSDKVERIFGVRPIEKDQITKRVTHHQLAVGHESASAEFQIAKPYLFALRQSQAAHSQNLNKLRRLSLKACSEVTSAVEYQGEAFEYQLGVCDWLLVEDDLFVRTDPAETASLLSDLLADAVGAALASMFRLGDGGDFARLLLCHSKDRDFLLRRMRGEGSQDDIEQLKSQFAFGPEVSFVPMNVPVQATIVNNVVSPPTPSAPTIPPSPEENRHHTPVESTPLSIVEQSRTVAPPPQHTQLRIQQPSRSGFAVALMARQVADWQFCEKKAMEFELVDNPPRFPLQVSLIQGFTAPGCDILSFATDEDRETFRNAENKDGRLVIRFIEVKARSSERAAITLKGNELNAAIQYKNRYYLYRLFEQDDGNLVLAVLQHPLGAQEAISQAIEVNLERAVQTHEYHLSGGLSKTAAANWDGKDLRVSV